MGEAKKGKKRGYAPLLGVFRPNLGAFALF